MAVEEDRKNQLERKIEQNETEGLIGRSQMEKDAFNQSFLYWTLNDD